MLTSDIIPSLNMERFSRFFTHKVMLLTWNHGLIHFPIVAKNHGFLYAGGLAILKYSVRLSTPITAVINYNLVVISLFNTTQTKTLMTALKANAHSASIPNTGVCPESTGFGIVSRGGSCSGFLWNFLDFGS